MNRKVGTLVWSGQKVDSPAYGRVLKLVVGLAGLVLAVLILTAVLAVIEPNVSTKIQDEADVSSARWAALGESYAPDVQMGAQTRPGGARWVRST